MKSIQTLIKLNSRELDDLRKLVVQCEEEKAKLVNENNEMDTKLLNEQLLAATDLQMGLMFVKYKQMIKKKQAANLESIGAIDRRLEYLKDEISLKFSEVKKYEILLANKILAQQKEELARETQQLDEVASNQFLRENAD